VRHEAQRWNGCNPTAHTRWAVSLWAVASIRCWMEVKELARKDTGAARGRPPRGRGWLSGSRGRKNEAGFRRRDTHPRPHHSLQTWAGVDPRHRGQPTSGKATESGSLRLPSQRRGQPSWVTRSPVGMAQSAAGATAFHRHRHSLVHSLRVHVGGADQEATGSRRPRSGQRGGAARGGRGGASPPRGAGRPEEGAPKDQVAARCGQTPRGLWAMGPLLPRAR
jgi:hypothetical protein